VGDIRRQACNGKQGMDIEDETREAKRLILFGIWFIISTFICYGELIYLIRGQVASGTVTNTYPTKKVLRVEYTFQDVNGTARKDTDSVDKDSDLAPGSNIDVQFTPGADGKSRISGHVNWFGIVFFALSVICLGAELFSLYREANSPIPKGRRAGRR